MKSKYAIIFSISITCFFLLNACTGGSMFNKFFKNKENQYFYDDRSEANEKMNKVLDAIINGDVQCLKELFAKNVIDKLEDFDQNATNLFEYFDGEFVSYDDWSGPGGDITREHGNMQKILYLSYDVITTEQEYRFAIQYYAVDTADADNVGIHSLYIIKMEDDIDPQIGYTGDNKNTPGINIGIKNELPKEDDNINAVSVDN